MKRYKVVGVVLLLGLATCASLLAQQAAMAPPQAPIPPASSPEALAAGARLAQQYCTRCHVEGITDGPAMRGIIRIASWCR
jgi:mono/diheme cytochrome c family protein